MRIVRPITVNDSNLISSTVAENDYAVYSSSTSYTLGQRVIVTSVHKIYESLRGGSAVVTISFAAPVVVGWKAHGLPNGAPITFTTTGTLPTGLTAGTTYYVVNAAVDTFNVAATLGGTAINTTGAGSGVHTGHDAANLNNDPTTNPSYWLDCGSTNKWSAFDGTVQSQTTATTSLSFTVNSATYVDTIPLLNVSATNARVQIVHGADGTVYDNTVSLVSDEDAVVDLWSYFFSGFRFIKDTVFSDLPPYSNTNITVTLNGVAGSTVGIGAAIFGLAKDISSTKLGVEKGAKVGITDYSVKTKDAFGNYIITERAFAKRANFTVYVNNTDIDEVENLLASYRAVPVVYIGSRKYANTLVYGYYKNFEIDISYDDVSVCSLELDGLT